MAIKFSFICSAIRSELYMRVCESVGFKTNIPHEIIYAGFSPPTQKMPSNFKYIVTHAFPAWAVEIAARFAVGEYIIMMPDDCLLSEGYINRLSYYIDKLGMEKCLIGGRYKYLNKPSCADMSLTVDMDDPKAPVTTICQAFNREVWNKIGGLDSRFTGIFYDIDMAMRFYEYGYTPFIMPDAYVEEDRFTVIPHTLLKKTGKESRNLLDTLWRKEDGRYSLKRSLPVIPLTDEQVKNSIEK